MNERIQELHEQAMKSCDEHRSDILNYHHIYREKFAELIVREAMMVVEGFTIEQEVALDQYEEYEASAVLKEHFGVEE